MIWANLLAASTLIKNGPYLLGSLLVFALFCGAFYGLSRALGVKHQMIREPISLRNKIIFGILSVASIITAYSVLSYRQHQHNPNDKSIPNLTQLVEGWKDMTGQNYDPNSLLNKEYWLLDDSKASAKRFLYSISLGVFLSVVVGMAMGVSPSIAAFLTPSISWLSKIPPTAMLAIYFVLFGYEMKMYLAMISIGIAPALIMAISASARKDVKDSAIHKAYTFGASHSEVIWGVVFKQILPRILMGIRNSLPAAMIFLIAAEYAVGDSGFGYRLRMQSRLLNFNVVYLYLAILGTAGVTMDYSLVWLRRKLCPWFGD
ncbi:MAG: hypothetical protein COA78_30565 [Blastopirellula sp.]|nr:MAG: hypothetical protein COA78_30565 [Blastopirellula sp.]